MAKSGQTGGESPVAPSERGQGVDELTDQSRSVGTVAADVPPIYVQNFALRNEWIVTGSKASLGIRVKGGDGFFYVAGAGLVSRHKTRFPTSQQGWEDAWRALIEEDPDAAASHMRRRREVEQARNQVGRSQDDAIARGNALAALRDLPTFCVVVDCALIGGFGHDGAELQVSHSLHFTHDALLIVEPMRGETVAAMEYGSMLALRVDGPGAVTRGGGFDGGGFGLEGAVEGMIVASLLNAVTQRTTVQTILEVQDHDRDFIFFTSSATPEELHARLKPVHAKLRAAKAPGPAPAVSSDDTLDRLERLGRMYEQGLLTVEEFTLAKRNVLGV